MIDQDTDTRQGATPPSASDRRTERISRTPTFKPEAAADAEREAAEGGLDGPKGPDVHTSLFLPPPESEKKGFQSREKAAELRVLRFTRRQRASALLMEESRIKAGKIADSRLTAGWSEPIKFGDADWIRPVRVARCKWRAAPDVKVHGSGTGQGHLSGVEKCASISACPVCSAVIRHARAADISAGVNNWQAGFDLNTGEAIGDQGAKDRYVMFMTLTLHHTRADTFKKGMDAVSNGWRDFTKNRAWKLYKARHGIVGYIRSFEVTFTEANGFHPHLHILFFCEGKRPTKRAINGEMSKWLLARWQNVVVNNGGGLPKKDGFDLQLVDEGGDVLGKYLSKVMEKDAEPVERKPVNIGAEMGRADFKTGNGRTTWTPLELLDRQEDDTLTARNGHLFVAYYHGTYRRKIITWSNGLRAILLPEVPERTDDEIMDDVEAIPEAVTIPGKTYDRIHRRPVTLAGLVDAAAWGEWDDVAQVVHSFAPPGS